MTETTVAAGHGAVKEMKKRPYVAVFATLAVVTLVELAITTPGYFLELEDAVRIAVLVVLSTAKACLVVAYYMHLRYEPRWLLLIPLGGLALVTVLVVALVGTLGGAPSGGHP